MPGAEVKRGDNLVAQLAGFAARLREAGLSLGTAELLDAVQALQNIDLSERFAFKTALQATMLKDRRHREVFDRLFSIYFVPAEVSEKQSREADRQRRQIDTKLEEARRSLRFKGEPLALSREEMLLYTSLPEKQRRGLLHFVRQTEDGKNVEPRFRPLLETVVKSHLRYWRGKMDWTGPGNESGGGAAGGGAGCGRPGESLHSVDIQAIREADLPAAEALIYRMSQQLARKILHRRQGAASRGNLDLRRSLRDNMCFGGTIFRLRYRRKRRSKQQLLLICDVSASMLPYSTFVLQFIYGLQAAVQNLESFCFADRLEYLSPDLQERGGLRQLLERVVEQSNTWGGGTNLAAALERLLEEYTSLCSARTVVLVVSDTRTVSLEPSLEALRRLKERAGEVIWLNPLPPEQWPYYRSVEAVGGLVEMWPCNTIARLEQTVSGRLLNKAKIGSDYMREGELKLI